MSNTPSMLVSPEDGDGESWYFEVTRHGEVWDGRAPTEEQARTDADALYARMVRMQDETGQTASKPIRRAVVRGQADRLATIQRYLPSNYSAVSSAGSVWIHGVDSAGWTLDDYVIPRLASGLYRAEEVYHLPDSDVWCKMTDEPIGTDPEDGDYFRCTVHDREVLGDAYVCEGYVAAPYTGGH